MSQGFRFEPRSFGANKSGETPLNEDQWQDLLRMYRSEPVVKVARDAFLSMVLCGPFKFKIPKLGIEQNADMDMIVERFWMPWLRQVYDWLRLFGVAPYYFMLPHSKSSHQIPVVPDPEKGYITVSVDDRTHQTKYHWYWTHGTTVKEEKKMLWVTRDDPPTIRGHIISPMASLLEGYRSLLVLRDSQDDASAQAAHPPHLFEFHPPKNAAGQDDLTHLKAQFGEKAAGLSRARQQEEQHREVRVRAKVLHQQLQRTYLKNRGINADPAMARGRVLWTDTPEDVVKRHNPALHERAVALPADYKYSTAAKPSLVADYEKAHATFNLIAAAVMNFPLEMIQPTGSARTQNIQGSIRFVNEQIKEWLTFFSSVAQAALIIAYREEFDQLFSDVKKRALNRRGGDPWDIALTAMPEVDVRVDMQCTPLMSYEELSQMHMDGIMDKDTFAEHAFHMRALPKSQMRVTEWPDKVPRELLVKPTAGSSKPAPKKKKSSEENGGTKRGREKETANSSDNGSGSSEKAAKPKEKKGKKGGAASAPVKSLLGNPATKTSEVRTVN